jgi:hypothetical protein
MALWTARISVLESRARQMQELSAFTRRQMATNRGHLTFWTYLKWL